MRNPNNFILLLITSLILSCLSYNTALGESATTPTTTPLSRATAETLVEQMNATMNSRLPYRIKSFFEYYMHPNAIIHKKSILVAPDDLENPQSTENVDYTRDQYIKALGKIVSVRGDYTYTASLNNFDVTPDGNSALLGITIEEMSAVRTSDDYANPPTYVRNFVATNCNFTAIATSSILVISDGSCIEKIVFN